MKKSILIPLLGICLMLASCGGDSSSNNKDTSSQYTTPSTTGYTPISYTITSNTEKNETNEKTNEKNEIIEKTVSLLNTSFDGEASYKINLINSEKKLTLTDTATIKKLDDGNFQYDYSYQYLNNLDSDSDELISTVSDSVVGDLNNVISSSNYNTYSNASTRMILEFKFYKELITDCTLLNMGNTNKIIGTLNTDLYNSTFNVSGSDYKFELAFDSTQNIISYVTINYKTNNFNISIDIDY